MMNYSSAHNASNNKTTSETAQSGSSNEIIQSPRTHVARRLPNGEVPTSKNTLRSFESSSYPTPVTAATAVQSSEKPYNETRADLVIDTEDFTDITTGTDDQLLNAIAAPVFEEAEAILYVATEVPPIVPNPEIPTSEAPIARKHCLSQRSKFLLWSIAVILLVVISIVAGAVGVSCASAGCIRKSNSNKESQSRDEIQTSAPIPSFNNTPKFPTMEPLALVGNLEYPSGHPTRSPPTIPSQSPNSFPDAIDATDRALIYTTYIRGITYSSQTLQNDVNGTAEEQALHWLITSDPILRTSTLDSASDQFRLRQRYSLLAIYFQQQSTIAVTPWANTSGWLTNDSECTWYGIICFEIDYGGDIGSQMAVVGIDLNNINVIGTIPSDLALLSSLESFEIYSNSIYGTIPSTLSTWTNLHTFYAFENALEGTLPNFPWSKIKHFSVTFNQLTGTLPVAISQWTDISSFSIFENRFNGSLPETLDEWRNIGHFLVRDNQFTGQLPEAIGKWTSLQFFNVSNNRFNGTIPRTIGQCSLIRMFSVGNNRLTGTLPYDIGRFNLLLHFGVEQNMLSGSIPISVGNWSIYSSVSYIGLQNNNFTGTVPNALCDNISKRNASTNVVADCSNKEVYCECCMCV